MIKSMNKKFDNFLHSYTMNLLIEGNMHNSIYKLYNKTTCDKINDIFECNIYMSLSSKGTLTGTIPVNINIILEDIFNQLIMYYKNLLIYNSINYRSF